jgi:phage-related protein
MGAISALASAGATALATAATFIASLIPAAISAGTVINVAFVGIPAILGAIAIAAGLVVGVLGNMDKVTASAKGAFDGLKNGIRRIGSALLTMAVPAFNLMVDIVGALLSPFFALAKGIGMVAGAFGLAGGEGSLLGGIINMLFSSFEGLMTVMGGIFKVLSTVFGAIGDIIFSGFLIPFQLIAGTINFVKTVLSGLFSLALQKIPFLSEAVGGVTGAFGKLVNVIKSIPSFFDSVATIISSTIDNLVQGLQDLLEPVVNAINEVISKANQLPGVNLDKVDISGLGGTADQLEGAKVSAQDVRENTRRRKKEPGQDVATEPNVNLSLEDSVENNVEVQAEPEDKAKISRLTKDALEEANSFARRRQGG